MNRTRQIFSSALVGVQINDHPAGAMHMDPREEVADSHVVSFVMRGAFTVTHARRRWRLTPRALFVTRPGFAYSCRHEQEAPEDICLSVVCDAAQAHFPLHVLRGHVPIVALTNRLAYLRHRLLGALAGGGDALAVESIAAETIAALSGGPDRLHSERQIAWYAERVDAVRGMFERDWAAPHSLDSVARRVGMSPFHFNRVFRKLTGLPPHRYLLEIRLRRAAELLRSGETVTRAALGAGFGNLSHFIRLFRRVHGVSPSRYALGGRRLPDEQESASGRISDGLTSLSIPPMLSDLGMIKEAWR